ncbi:MAG TPA: TIGR03564 family F420-dependent LLM class oxidoreductase [Acidimicrobiales bacterium]
MRIGLPGGGTTVDRIIHQAEQAEADGFTSLWYASAVAGDPLTAMALAGRATERIELGTAVLVTYACHPVLQANRAAATAAAIGAPGRFTLGVGPSHQPVVEGVLGLSYATPGRHVEEYVQVLAALLRGEHVRFAGQELRVDAGPPTLPEGGQVPVLVGALAPRLLRVAGQHAAGTVTWMANATALERHVVPRITRAAADAGRPAPRVVAGLPVAVHDDVAEARAAAAEAFALYGTLPNYQRILAYGGVDGPADAAIVGDEERVTAQIEALFAAGATDVWAAPFPVGADRSASRARTRALLKELAKA